MLSYTKILWTMMFIVLLINIMWIKFSSITFYYNTEKSVALLLVSTFIYMLYIVYSKFRPDPKIAIALLSTLYLVIGSALLLLLSYLAFTTNLPFVDSTIATIDGYMGFSSLETVFMVRNHRWLYITLDIIYNSMLPQAVIIVLYFSFLGDKVYLERFLMLFLISLLLTISIGALLPAAGPYVWYDYTPSPDVQRALDRLYELRNNIVNISKEDGIISFPSFHTILALIYIYTFRNEKKIIFIPFLIFNTVMILSCLPMGEHYLSDIVAGIMVFAATLGLEQLIFWSVEKYRDVVWLSFQQKKYETR